MSTVAFSAFYDLLMPELKGATTSMVDLHLLHTARDFCERTSAWRFPFTVSSTADEDTYDISAPELRSEIVRVCRLTIDDVVLFDADWQPTLTTDEPSYDRSSPPFTVNIENTEITLIEDEIPGEDGTDNIEIVAALKPSFASTTLPEFLKFEHLEAMRTGTLSRLMQMGNKPWTDRALAGVYRSEYQAHLQFAASKAQRGNTRTILRTRPW